LTNQIRSFIYGVLELPGKDVHRKAWEGDFDSGAIRLHGAAGRVIAGCAAMNFFRLARKVLIAAADSWQHERSVPEHHPLSRVEVLRIGDPELPQRRELIGSNAALPGDEGVLGRQTVAQNLPLA